MQSDSHRKIDSRLLQLASLRCAEKQIKTGIAVFCKTGGKEERPNVRIESGEQAAIHDHRIETDVGTRLPDIAGFDGTADIERHIENAAAGFINLPVVDQPRQSGVRPADLATFESR